jgi:hypothetical protein
MIAVFRATGKQMPLIEILASHYGFRQFGHWNASEIPYIFEGWLNPQESIEKTDVIGSYISDR